MLYQWLILQDGSLPLDADGRRTRQAHVCTATLIWPAGGKPTRANSVLVDPCFSPAGRQVAERRLAERDADLSCIGYFFETHQHFDHVLQLPAGESTLAPHPQGVRPPEFTGPAAVWDWLLAKPAVDAGNEYGWIRVSQHCLAQLPGIELIPCPGHAADLQAIRCQTAEGETWLVGDAILDRPWLTAWMFYWPNRYEGPEIVETWRSVGAVLATADLVIPGHGPPLVVDGELLRMLLDRFPRAFLAHQCPEVADRLRNRLERN